MERWPHRGVAVKSVCWLILCAFALRLHAQTPPQSTSHAPDGGTSFHIESIDVPPLTGAPFTAIVTTEWTRILADGTTATIKNRRTIARDSTGRVFQERRVFSADGDVQPTPFSALEYSDPSRQEFLSCVPRMKTCHESRYLRSAFDRMPASTGGVQACQCASRPGKGITITQEALGQQTMEDLEAIGSREITTLPAGAIGNTNPQPIVKEFWYSPRLGINLVTKRFEPQAGAEDFVVSHVSLDEPNPALFEPPADYKVMRSVVVKAATPTTGQ
jgi:hypothetical protein